MIVSLIEEYCVLAHLPRQAARRRVGKNIVQMACNDTRKAIYPALPAPQPVDHHTTSHAACRVQCWL